MAHKIAIYNKKGGVGKSVISVNLAATIAATKDDKGQPKYRVLMVDMDPQENASDYLACGTTFRADEDAKKSLGAVLRGGNVSDNVIPYYAREYVRINEKGDDIHKYDQWMGFDDDGNVKTEKRAFRYKLVENFHVLPAYADLESDAPPQNGNYGKILGVLGQEADEFLDEDIFRASLPVETMMEKLKPIENQYDFILFDCPPAWDRFAKMAVYASNQIIIPLKPGEFERLGLGRVLEQLEALKISKGRRPDLIFAVMGMLRGNVKKHNAYHRKAFNELSGLVADTGIPFTEEVNNTQSDLVPFAFSADKYKTMAETFQNIFKELLSRMEELKKVKESV